MRYYYMGKIGDSGYVETVYPCHSKRKRDSICRRRKNYIALSYFDARRFMAKRISAKTEQSVNYLNKLTPTALLETYLGL